jgi:hypothetical protein
MASTALFFWHPPSESEFKITLGGTSETSLFGKPSVDYIDRVEGYFILKRIPVKYEEADDTDIEAIFEEANIAISGISRQDAHQALVENILTAFDDWSANENALGPGPKKQLAVLKTYIAKATP